MRGRVRVVFVLGTLTSVLFGAVSPASGIPPSPPTGPDPTATLREGVTSLGSGQAQFRDQNFGTGLTECPHAGEPSDKQPKPLDRRNTDKVEQLSNGGDDRRVNQDYSCFPQNETSIAVNPLNPKNLVAGQNDYRLGWGTSGFDASTDNGNHWYDGIIPFPTLPNGDNLDGGGDPAIAFDSAGVAYWVDINFNRTDDTNGIFVVRSTNGGFTWSRPCVPIRPNPATRDNERCGGTAAVGGDPRKPGDGVVTFQQDNNQAADFSVPFNDKEYVAVGPRPAGQQPMCFRSQPPTTAESAAALLPTQPIPPSSTVQCPEGTVGAGRIHVTWTKFEVAANTLLLNANVYYSFSDDQGRSWAPERVISGASQRHCGFNSVTGLNDCDANQFSVPTVHPVTGFLWVAFENFNTDDENQYLVVRSYNGGITFDGPYFVTPIFDTNYPRGNRGRQDCVDRGQGATRAVLTNSCFRVNSAGNIVVDRRPVPQTCLSPAACPDLGFADDLYLVMSDNRNGTPARSNTDVFFFRSTDGGMTWIGPTRVNDDESRLTGRRTSLQNTNVIGNDQFFPWVDISSRGDVNVVFYDRRLDTVSTLHEWPGSRQTPGNYLTWTWGAVCSVTTTALVSVPEGGTPPTTLPSGVQQCLGNAAGVTAGTNRDFLSTEDAPGASQTTFPFKNFTVSDVPSNMDYAFRAGIFIGDYNNVAIGPDNTAYAFWTDARNGRSSRAQEGRNPACEQADVFVDSYSAQSGGTAQRPPSLDVINLFSVTPCPTDAQDPGNVTTP